MYRGYNWQSLPHASLVQASSPPCFSSQPSKPSPVHRALIRRNQHHVALLHLENESRTEGFKGGGDRKIDKNIKMQKEQNT